MEYARFCQFEHVNGNVWKCPECGLKITSEHPEKVRVICHPRTPGILQQAVHFATAAAVHAATGAKKRTDDEVAEILEICRGCERYNADNSTCTVCGCRLSDSQNAYANKIRMQTQHCPRQKW